MFVMRLMRAKLARDLGWKPAETFESGMRKTVEWYFSKQGMVGQGGARSEIIRWLRVLGEVH